MLLLREISDNYEHLAKNIHPITNLRFLEVFASIPWQDHYLYNRMIEHLGDNFKDYALYEVAQFVNHFTKAGHFQVDLVKVLLDSVNAKFTNANIGTDIAISILTSVARANLHHLPEFETFYKKLLSTEPGSRLLNLNFLERVPRLFNSELLIEWFSTDAPEKFPELTEALTTQLAQRENLNLKFNQLQAFGAAFYGREVSEKVSELVKEALETENRLSVIHKQSGLEQTLESLGVNFEMQAKVEGVIYDCYLPEKNIALVLQDQHKLNFSRDNTNNLGAALKRTYENSPKKPTVLEVNLFKLKMCNSPEDKLKYLKDIGLPQAA